MWVADTGVTLQGSAWGQFKEDTVAPRLTPASPWLQDLQGTERVPMPVPSAHMPQLARGRVWAAYDFPSTFPPLPKLPLPQPYLPRFPEFSHLTESWLYQSTDVLVGSSFTLRSSSEELEGSCEGLPGREAGPDAVASPSKPRDPQAHGGSGSGWPPVARSRLLPLVSSEALIERHRERVRREQSSVPPPEAVADRAPESRSLEERLPSLARARAILERYRPRQNKEARRPPPPGKTRIVQSSTPAEEQKAVPLCLPGSAVAQESKSPAPKPPSTEPKKKGFSRLTRLFSNKVAPAPSSTPAESSGEPVLPSMCCKSHFVALSRMNEKIEFIIFSLESS